MIKLLCKGNPRCSLSPRTHDYLSGISKILLILCLVHGALSSNTVLAIDDTTDPVLVDFSLDKQVIDVISGPETVTLTLRVTDDLSGFEHGYMKIQSPSHEHELNIYFYVSDLVSGDVVDGVYEFSVDFPQFSESGIWVVASVYLYDEVGNIMHMNEAEFAATGYQNTIQVNSVDDTPTMTLYSGWNLISFYSLPTDSSPGYVLAEVVGSVQAVWGFDGETKVWNSYSPGAPSSLSEFELGMGYWVKVDQTIELSLPWAP